MVPFMLEQERWFRWWQVGGVRSAQDKRAHHCMILLSSNMSVVSAVETFKDLVGSVPSNVEIPLDLNAVVVASSWLARLADATARKAGYESIFVEESHWRDHIALTASLRSISSRPAVIAAWSQCTQRAHPYDFHLVDGTAQVIRAGPGLAWLQARYTFKTQVRISLSSGCTTPLI